MMTAPLPRECSGRDHPREGIARILAVVLVASAGLVAPARAFAASLAFTMTPGTTSCGSPGLTSAPSVPFSGEVDADTAGTAKIVDLGLGCVYAGGGNATVIFPGTFPDGGTTYLDVLGTSLVASAGTSVENCTLGAGPGRHCVNGNAGLGGGGCGTDADCGGMASSCALDANCYLGPPLAMATPPPFSSLTTCLLQVVQSDASGVFDPSTGTASLDLPISSRVYITGNSASPCPRCLSGSCDPTWKTNTNQPSPDSGAACTAVGSEQTTPECRPSLPGLQGPVALALDPLTTGAVTLADPSGLFCPSQPNAGAFGQSTAERIVEVRTPAGDLTDGGPHPIALGSAFCIPTTGNPALDAVIDLPGPGALSLGGTVQIVGGSAPVPAGGTITTDTGGGATSAAPVQVAITTPNAGNVTATIEPSTSPRPPGFAILSKAVQISAPAATADDPLVLDFEIDASLIPPGQNENTITILKDGMSVPDCIGATTASPHDPCVSQRVALPGGDVKLTVLTSTASLWGFEAPLPPCAPAPSTGCHEPGASSLAIKDNADAAKDQLKWKWGKGTATDVGEFADPVGGSAIYRVCVYDASAQSQPIMEMNVPPGGTCGKAPCWKAAGSTGFGYKNKAGTPNGLTRMKLKAGATGHASVKALGKGGSLPMPALPLTLPVTVQLVIDGGSTKQCWQTTYSAASADDPAQFIAKGP